MKGKRLRIGHHQLNALLLLLRGLNRIVIDERTPDHALVAKGFARDRGEGYPRYHWKGTKRQRLVGRFELTPMGMCAALLIARYLGWNLKPRSLVRPLRAMAAIGRPALRRRYPTFADDVKEPLKKLLRYWAEWNRETKERLARLAEEERTKQKLARAAIERIHRKARARRG